MARNGNNGSVNIQAALEDAAARASRLKELGKAQADLDKRRSQLDAEQEKLNHELATLTGNGTVRVGRKPKAEKAEKAEKQPRKARAKKADKAVGNGTMSLHEVLLSVMPGNDALAISKDDIAALVVKSGYKSSAKDPKVVIGQALGKSSDFQNVSRGLWRLSKRGENNRNKQSDTPAEKPTASATPATAPATPASPVATADEPATAGASA